MPGSVVTTATTMTCPHSGTVTAVASQSRALAGGAPILTSPAAIAVVCTLTSAVRCTAVTWSALATRVLASGRPVLLQSLPPGPVPGDGVCVGPPAPPPAPLVVATQLRATGR